MFQNVRLFRFMIPAKNEGKSREREQRTVSNIRVSTVLVHGERRKDRRELRNEKGKKQEKESSGRREKIYTHAASIFDNKKVAKVILKPAPSFARNCLRLRERSLYTKVKTIMFQSS